MGSQNHKNLEVQRSPERLTLSQAVIEFVDKAEATIDESMVLTEIKMIAKSGDETKLTEFMIEEMSTLKAIALSNIENENISRESFDKIMDVLTESRLEKELYNNIKNRGTTKKEEERLRALERVSENLKLHGSVAKRSELSVKVIRQGIKDAQLQRFIKDNKVEVESIVAEHLKNGDMNIKIILSIIKMIGEKRFTVRHEEAVNSAIVERLKTDSPDMKTTMQLIGMMKNVGQQIKPGSAIKNFIFKLLKIENGDLEGIRELMRLNAENEVMSELYIQIGKSYELGGHSESATDCVQILRQSPAFAKIVDHNPIRFFSEGSDLVLSEELGRVKSIVDRENFEELRRYKPTKDKLYVFALVKPPFIINGKPNVTHLQIPTDLQADPSKLAIIHASTDKNAVVIEDDIVEYLEGKSFGRVYVIEINLKNPYTKRKSEREPVFRSTNHKNSGYDRPQIYDMPIIRDHLKLIDKDKDVEIYPEERSTLELISNNKVLSYITILTGIREGKLGAWNNAWEEMAYKIYADPSEHSVGLHQLTSVVAKLFDKWIGTINIHEAKALGVLKLWEQKREGVKVSWEEIAPSLANYDITDKRYKDTKLSTICAYLYLKHLFEDQLISAYRAYGETFYGLEEQPEAIIAIGSGHRHSMGVFVRGCQQYRIAEMAHKLGLIDSKFEFTGKAKRTETFKGFEAEVRSKYAKWTPGRHGGDVPTPKGMKEAKMRQALQNEYMVDGYAGMQTHMLAFLCYKELNPNGQITIDDFHNAYEGNQTGMLNSQPARKMQEEYTKMFGAKPKLLMTEQELRGKTRTGLDTHIVKFANEGLWVYVHYKKMVEENWKELKGMRGRNGTWNPLFEQEFQIRSLKTNEISKIPSGKIQRFSNLIESLPSSEWYKKYPDLLLSICFTQNLFQKERMAKDGKWIEETKSYFKQLFSENLPKILARIEVKQTDLRTMAELAALSSIMSVEKIVETWESGIPADKILDIVDTRGVKRLRIFEQSFRAQRKRFDVKDPSLLIKYSETKENLQAYKTGTTVERTQAALKMLTAPALNEEQQREAFVLSVFRGAKAEAAKRGLSLNFAILATAMASLECGWGRETNMETGLPTLYSGANNIFSIKYNTKQYTKEDYEGDNSYPRYYIHHTVEYFDKATGKKTEHYEAFRRYKKIGDSTLDFFDLIERKYPKTIAAGKMDLDSLDPNPKVQEAIIRAILEEKYATDPEYAEKTLPIAKKVESILRKYGQII